MLFTRNWRGQVYCAAVLQNLRQILRIVGLFLILLLLSSGQDHSHSQEPPRPGRSFDTAYQLGVTDGRTGFLQGILLQYEEDSNEEPYYFRFELEREETITLGVNPHPDPGNGAPMLNLYSSSRNRIIPPDPIPRWDEAQELFCNPLFALVRGEYFQCYRFENRKLEAGVYYVKVDPYRTFINEPFGVQPPDNFNIWLGWDYLGSRPSDALIWNVSTPIRGYYRYDEHWYKTSVEGGEQLRFQLTTHRAEINLSLNIYAGNDLESPVASSNSNANSGAPVYIDVDQEIYIQVLAESAIPFGTDYELRVQSATDIAQAPCSEDRLDCSELTVTSQCSTDGAEFTITNVGDDMLEPTYWELRRDGRIIDVAEEGLQLSGGESVQVSAAGSGDYQLSVDQQIDFPGEETVRASLICDFNRPPSLSSIPPQTIPLGSLVDIPVTGSDPDGDSVTLSFVSNDDSIVSIIFADNREVQLEGKLPGSTTIQVTATDSKGAQTIIQFAVVVPPPELPTCYEEDQNGRVSPGGELCSLALPYFAGIQIPENLRPVTESIGWRSVAPSGLLCLSGYTDFVELDRIWGSGHCTLTLSWDGNTGTDDFVKVSLTVFSRQSALQDNLDEIERDATCSISGNFGQNGDSETCINILSDNLMDGEIIARNGRALLRVTFRDVPPFDSNAFALSLLDTFFSYSGAANPPSEETTEPDSSEPVEPPTQPPDSSVPMVYVDFEDPTAYQSWGVENTTWSVKAVGDNNLLESHLDSSISMWIPNIAKDMAVYGIGYDVMLTKNSRAQLAFGISEAGYYILEISDEGVVFLYRGSGSMVSRSSANILVSETIPVEPSGWYRVRMAQNGQQLQVYIDDNLVINFADATVLTAGNTTLGMVRDLEVAEPIRFDNIWVMRGSQTPTLPPVPTTPIVAEEESPTDSEESETLPDFILDNTFDNGTITFGYPSHLVVRDVPATQDVALASSEQLIDEVLGFVRRLDGDFVAPDLMAQKFAANRVLELGDYFAFITISTYPGEQGLDSLEIGALYSPTCSFCLAAVPVAGSSRLVQIPLGEMPSPLDEFDLIYYVLALDESRFALIGLITLDGELGDIEPQLVTAMDTLRFSYLTEETDADIAPNTISNWQPITPSSPVCVDHVLTLTNLDASSPALALIDLSIGNQTLISQDIPIGNTEVASPDLSPDGQWAVFTGNYYGNLDLYIASIDGQNLRPLVTSDYQEINPKWSPDGRYVAFERWLVDPSFTDRNRDLFVFDVTTGLVTQITNHPSDDKYPAWHPDGTKIAFVSDRNNIRGIFVYDLTTGTLTRLSDGSRGEDTLPTYSPDGRLIAFRTTGNDNIIGLVGIMNADGSGSRIISDASVPLSRPVLSPAKWSDDSQLLAYQGYAGTIYILQLESYLTRRLNTDAVFLSSPSWLCGSTEITFIGNFEGIPYLYSTPALPISAPPLDSITEANRLSDALYTDQPASTSISGILIGDMVTIDTLGGSSLPVMSAPSISAEPRFEVSTGEQFTVMDGPTSADGFEWWQIRDPNDPFRVGWMVSDYLQMAGSEVAEVVIPASYTPMPTSTKIPTFTSTPTDTPTNTPTTTDTPTATMTPTPSGVPAASASSETFRFTVWIEIYSNDYLFITHAAGDHATPNLDLSDLNFRGADGSRFNMSDALSQVPSIRSMPPWSCMLFSRGRAGGPAAPCTDDLGMILDQSVTFWTAGNVFTVYNGSDWVAECSTLQGELCQFQIDIVVNQTTGGGGSSEPIQCPGAPVSRMIVGEQWRVTAGDPNSFRAGPSRGSTKIGEIPSLGVFTVISGPVCSDGLAYWEVNYNGTIGWTAEGQGNTYWTEPIQ